MLGVWCVPSYVRGRVPDFHTLGIPLLNHTTTAASPALAASLASATSLASPTLSTDPLAPADSLPVPPVSTPATSPPPLDLAKEMVINVLKCVRVL